MGRDRDSNKGTYPSVTFTSLYVSTQINGSILIKEISQKLEEAFLISRNYK